MEPFEALNQGGQVRRLRRLAEVALQAYPLREMRSRQDYPALRAALLAGYRRIRPLAAEYEEYLESFFALRRVQLMIWDMEMREHPLWRKGWPAYVTRVLQTLQTFVET